MANEVLLSKVNVLYDQRYIKQHEHLTYQTVLELVSFFPRQEKLINANIEISIVSKQGGQKTKGTNRLSKISK